MERSWNDQFHMEWAYPPWIPWNSPYGIPDGFHGFHMDSILNNLGKVKTSNLVTRLCQFQSVLMSVLEKFQGKLVHYWILIL